MLSIDRVSNIVSIIGFALGVPTVAATYYQSWRTRKEATEAREGLLYSANCLEFVLEDGEVVNLVPLESLHSLPAPGDIVLLPGAGGQTRDELLYGAYRIESVEHIYALLDDRRALARQARLAKAVAHIEAVTSPSIIL